MVFNEEIPQELLSASTYLNGYSPFIPWSISIGLKPNLIRYADRGHSPLLAENYLLNSYYTRGDIESELSIEHFYEEACIVTQALNNQRDYYDFKRIALPVGISLDMSLGEAMLRRRSVNEFTGDSVNLDYLATVVRSVKGVSDTGVAKLREGKKIRLNFSTISSAGHLYPIDVYFLAFNIKNLDSGIYHYLENEDVLIKIGDEKKALHVLDTFIKSKKSINYSRSNYICLFVAHPWKSMSKYGNRGLRFILQEIGAMTQNMHLANVALGLGSMDWGGYYENEINQILGFDGINQSVLHIILAGIIN
ncbi:MAG: nitroreductase [Gammaproteobacteria bacterium]|jgi:SagB-type dehydrogenase family enzyme|nr:nitroreductase [Gammaproteobacteria bacterium]